MNPGPSVWWVPIVLARPPLFNKGFTALPSWLVAFAKGSHEPFSSRSGVKLELTYQLKKNREEARINGPQPKSHGLQLLAMASNLMAMDSNYERCPPTK